MDQIAGTCRSAISACLAVFGAVFDYWRMKLGRIWRFGSFVLVLRVGRLFLAGRKAGWAAARKLLKRSEKRVRREVRRVQFACSEFRVPSERASERASE